MALRLDPPDHKWLLNEPAGSTTFKDTGAQGGLDGTFDASDPPVLTGHAAVFGPSGNYGARPTGTLTPDDVGTSFTLSAWIHLDCAPGTGECPKHGTILRLSTTGTNDAIALSHEDEMHATPAGSKITLTLRQAGGPSQPGGASNGFIDASCTGAGSYCHVAVTVSTAAGAADGGVATFYRNGAAHGTQAGRTLPTGDAPFSYMTIGCGSGQMGGQVNFKGSIFDVRIYRQRALSAAEVAALACSTGCAEGEERRGCGGGAPGACVPRRPDPPDHRWKLDEPPGSTTFKDTGADANLHGYLNDRVYPAYSNTEFTGRAAVFDGTGNTAWVRSRGGGYFEDDGGGSLDDLGPSFTMMAWVHFDCVFGTGGDCAGNGKLVHLNSNSNRGHVCLEHRVGGSGQHARFIMKRRDEDGQETVVKVTGTRVFDTTCADEGTYCHVAVTFNNRTGEVTMFANGAVHQRWTNQAGVLPMGVSYYHITIGGGGAYHGFGEQYNFKGSILDVRLYKQRALTAAEVAKVAACAPRVLCGAGERRTRTCGGNLLHNTNLDDKWNNGQYNSNLEWNTVAPPDDVAVFMGGSEPGVVGPTTNVVGFVDKVIDGVGMWYSYHRNSRHAPMEDNTEYTMSIYVMTELETDVSLWFYTCDNDEANLGRRQSSSTGGHLYTVNAEDLGPSKIPQNTISDRTHCIEQL